MYEMANLRISDVGSLNQPVVHHGVRESLGSYDNVNSRCILHKFMNNHSTEECRGYINKTSQEKLDLLLQLRGWPCLKIGLNAEIKKCVV